MTYEEFMSEYGNAQRKDAECRTIRLDVKDTLNEMLRKTRDKILGNKYGTLFVAVCDDDVLVDDLKVLEMFELGTGRSLDVFPLEGSAIADMRGVSIDGMITYVYSAYHKDAQE